MTAININELKSYQTSKLGNLIMAFTLAMIGQ